MWQDCSLATVQRKTAFVEQSWFMMGWIWHVWINAIVFVPTAKAPPKAGAKELDYKSLNLAYSGHPSGHPCFGPNWFIQFCHIWREYAVPRKALPRKQANVDTGHQILPGLAQGSFQIEQLDRTTKAIAQINADWKVEKAQYAEFNAPTCDKIAVWQLCKETQPLWNSLDLWWPEFDMFGSMPLCSFPRQKLIPKLGQKSWHTRVWI